MRFFPSSWLVTPLELHPESEIGFFTVYELGIHPQMFSLSAIESFVSLTYCHVTKRLCLSPVINSDTQCTQMVLVKGELSIPPCTVYLAILACNLD